MRSGSWVPVVRFGEFALDARRRSLSMWRDGSELRLRPKSFDLLCHLIEHRGRVVSKDELVAALWPGVIVTDDSVFQCVRDVRAVLRDEARQIVRTISRRGYLFAADVIAVDDVGDGACSQPDAGLRIAVLPFEPAAADGDGTAARVIAVLVQLIDARSGAIRRASEHLAGSSTTGRDALKAV